MALRRQILSFDDWVHTPFYHQTNPSKWRTINNVQYAPGYQPSRWTVRQFNQYQSPTTVDKPFRDWIGKKLLYWEGESIYSYIQQIRMMKYGENSIGEYEIAQFTRPNIYRIIFIDKQGKWRSKPSVEYMAGRLNIFVDPDDVIRNIAYF
jgi:hypothetical protein